jgi:hypothetical protein
MDILKPHTSHFKSPLSILLKGGTLPLILLMLIGCGIAAYVIFSALYIEPNDPLGGQPSLRPLNTEAIADIKTWIEEKSADHAKPLEFPETVFFSPPPTS